MTATSAAGPSAAGPSAARAPACSGALPAPTDAPYPLVIARTRSGFSARSGSEELRCDAALASRPPVLVAGLRRVLLPRLALDDVATPPPLPWGLHALALAGGAVLLALVVALEQLAGTSLRRALLSSLPLAACALLTGVDASPLREITRVPHLPVRWIPLLVGVLLTLAARFVGYAARLAAWPRSPRLRAASIGLVILAAALVAFGGARTQASLAIPMSGVAVGSWGLARLLARERDAVATATAVVGLGALAGAALSVVSGVALPGGRLYLALAGACVGGLVWLTVHATRVRLYNVASFVLAVGVLGYLEGAAHFTVSGAYWAADLQGRGAGSQQTMVETFAALDSATPAAYPSAGFPVRAPPKRAPVRVVCLGGSSTGGAFQDDDLDHFYPAVLDRLLGSRVEVVNQGVGGWTSFHVAHFASAWLASLHPDVVTVYLGVNEGTDTLVPYAQLYERWRAGTLTSGPAWVYRLRLYNLLRFVVRGVRGDVMDEAVPPGDFEANLEALGAATAKAGARLLVMSEAVQPDPTTLSRYWKRMATVADRHDDIAYFDTASAMQAAGGPLFLDANHLTPTGHRVLAQLIAAELVRLGWIDPPTVADPEPGPRRAPP